MKVKQSNKDSKGTQIPSWTKYMGLSFQLFTLIGGGTALGWWLQQQSSLKFPLWLLLGCFASVALAFYSLWKSIQQEK
ncbi:MAG: AtpZ/AtpI family protein [Bacteroidetes bacterium]|nr:AtpZ/AtpI family protein [Bacteroidota bacterium]MDA1267746.1 AtpZ/AtpI family protein [Bacteroidota bacterium]